MSLGVGALLYVSNPYEATKHKETSMHLTRLGTCRSFQLKEGEIYLSVPTSHLRDDMMINWVVVFFSLDFIVGQILSPFTHEVVQILKNYLFTLTISLNIFSHKSLILSKVRAHSQVLTFKKIKNLFLNSVWFTAGEILEVCWR